ncbi:hypothetical protein GWI33_014177 [Rhynchophorus ferrugineus]|uniref:Uncharacterized protein n=1 Tax=Rhynchophorus ferrugineus TaxID=354439 RepID=A0A834I7Q7_RHYFE|nr:hypothetical protein GWI33_014177 [Rhynchophorus ferrugineus]
MFFVNVVTCAVLVIMVASNIYCKPVTELDKTIYEIITRNGNITADSSTSDLYEVVFTENHTNGDVLVRQTPKSESTMDATTTKTSENPVKYKKTNCIGPVTLMARCF